MKAMRTDLKLSQKIVIATGILFNIARAWGDAGPDEEESDNDDEEDDGVEHESVRPATDPVIVTEGDPASVRVRGQVERERLMTNM